jgi:hypothetical protein
LCFIFDPKMGWAIFWAISSQTYLVTLLLTDLSQVVDYGSWKGPKSFEETAWLQRDQICFGKIIKKSAEICRLLLRTRITYMIHSFVVSPNPVTLAGSKLSPQSSW